MSYSGDSYTLRLFQDKSDTHKTDVHWETVCSFETTYHVDTIEFSPDHDIAICGSYELDEVNWRRSQIEFHCASHIIVTYQ